MQNKGSLNFRIIIIATNKIYAVQTIVFLKGYNQFTIGRINIHLLDIDQLSQDAIADKLDGVFNITVS